MCIRSVGLSGEMGFWWKDINVCVRSFSVHHFVVGVCDDNDNVVWHAIRVYGWSEVANKHQTWTLMRELCVGVNVPIMMFGYFYEITSLDEKFGGTTIGERQMTAFRIAIDDVV